MTALKDEILHGSSYDPAKAHAYYIANRKLKGRARNGTLPSATSNRSGQGDQGGTTGGTSNGVLRPSRKSDLEKRVEDLRAKAEQLRSLIQQRVKEAKKRAGVDVDKEEEAQSSSKTSKSKETGKESATKDSKSKPLTEKQKSDKRKASKEQYEKENGTSLAREAQALRNTIENLQERLHKLKVSDRKEDPSKRQNGR